MVVRVERLWSRISTANKARRDMILKPNKSQGPSFTRVKPQRHPNPKVQDIGVQMRLGSPQHSHRIFRNIRDHAPYAFWFDDVVVLETELLCDLNYPAHLSRNTATGTFVPLSAYLAALYADGVVNRDIFTVLTELNDLLPPDRLVTTKDLLHFCKNLGKATPLPPEPPVEPPAGILVQSLEERGFRLTELIKEQKRSLLSISWLPESTGRRFFVGILELRPTRQGTVVGKWTLPGPCGVPQLLRHEFEQMSQGPGTILTPAGQQHCLKGVGPVGSRIRAKQSSAWTTEKQTAMPAKSSSSPSRQRNKLS